MLHLVEIEFGGDLHARRARTDDAIDDALHGVADALFSGGLLGIGHFARARIAFGLRGGEQIAALIENCDLGRGKPWRGAGDKIADRTHLARRQGVAVQLQHD